VHLAHGKHPPQFRSFVFPGLRVTPPACILILKFNAPHYEVTLPVPSRGRRTVLCATLASIAVILLAGCLSSCCGSKDTATRFPNQPVQQSPSLPPNACRFAGTIISVLPPESGRDDGPCSKVPCTAQVRVDTILGYGSSFPYPVAAGTVVTIRFAYTLTPSASLFPGRKDLPSSLIAGDAFHGVMEGTEGTEGLAQAPGSPRTFTVSTYQKK